MPLTRRKFTILSISILGVGFHKVAMALESLLETHPQAIGLGYKVQSISVDSSKYPKHLPSQMCGNCVLFKPIDSGCQIFPGKLVSPIGWCAAYARGVEPPKPISTPSLDVDGDNKTKNSIDNERIKLEEERRQLAEERRKLEEEKRKLNTKPPVNNAQDIKRQKCINLGLAPNSVDFQQCMK